MNLPTHYRIVDRNIGGDIAAFVEIFRAIRETPEGFWVVPSHSHLQEGCSLLSSELRRHGGRWVSKHATKRYCYPALSEAVTSFEHRKSRQSAILKSQAEQAAIAAAGACRCRGATLADFYNGLVLGERFDYSRLFG